jgi:CheY-like chemotaxis protein
MSPEATEGKVLLVDDDPMLRECASALLVALGFEVILATDGLDALEKYQAHPGAIAIVIMDITMPRLDGVEAAKRIRAIDPDARVILSSGGTHLPPLDARPDGFLPKPYRGKDLLESILKVLGVNKLHVPWVAGI